MKGIKQYKRKEAIRLVRSLYPTNVKRSLLKNTNKKAIDEKWLREGVLEVNSTLRRNGSEVCGIIKRTKVYEGVSDKREGLFFIGEETGETYQIPLKRVLIDDGLIDGVLIDMQQINNDTSPSNGRFYGVIRKN